MSQGPARPGSVRWISVAAFATWGLLFLISYRYLPPLQYAWGFNLIRYHPDWAAWLLTGIGLLFTTEEARRGAIAAGRALASRVGSLPTTARDLVICALVLATLWGVHERVPGGYAELLRVLVIQDPVRLYPESGGFWAFRLLSEWALAVGWRPVPTVQAIHCAAGAATVLFVLRAARLALPVGRGAGAVTLLVFSGGLAAAIAGRFDVHAFAIAASAAYLWLGLRFIRGESGLGGAALAAGLAAWFQPLCCFALPALWLLPRLADRKHEPIAIVSIVPVAFYAAYLLAINPKDVPPADVLARLVVGAEGWVRGWNSGDSMGTDVVLLSLPHLEYLVNAAFVLAPASLPLLIGIGLHGRRHAFASPEVRFVTLVALSLVIGAVLTRPAAGPFDWDLFAVAALWLAFLAGVLVARLETPAIRDHLVAAAVGLQLCFVGVPLLAIGQGPKVDVGPFAPDRFDLRILERGTPAPKALRPWL